MWLWHDSLVTVTTLLNYFRVITRNCGSSHTAVTYHNNADIHLVCVCFRCDSSEYVTWFSCHRHHTFELLSSHYQKPQELTHSCYLSQQCWQPKYCSAPTASAEIWNSLISTSILDSLQEDHLHLSISICICLVGVELSLEMIQQYLYSWWLVKMGHWVGILIKLVVAASDRYISSHNGTSLIFMVMGTCKNTSVAQVGHIRRWHWGNKFFYSGGLLKRI